MKINLGCGQNKIEGAINIDKFGLYEPDKMFSLDDPSVAWDLENDSVDEVYAFHIVEHLGNTTEEYFHFIKELYRVCKDGAIIHVVVPHCRNDNFLHDPTHVRPITEHHFLLFSKQRNEEQQSWGGSETKLGFYLNVDFETIDIRHKFEADVEQQLQSGQMSTEQLQSMIRLNNNIVSEIYITLKVKK